MLLMLLYRHSVFLSKNAVYRTRRGCAEKRENLSARYDYHLYLLLQSEHIIHIRYHHNTHDHVWIKAG